MSEIETSEERPLDDITRDENPGDIVLEAEHWVDDIQVEVDLEPDRNRK